MIESVDIKRVPKFTLSTGEKIPCIGMGTFGSDRYSPEQVSNAVAGAIRCGYRLFDCASVYGNENLIGVAIADAIVSGVVKREELFIASKVWNDMHGEGDVLLSMAKTLKDLKLNYTDAYYVHWPFPNYHAPGCDGDSRNPDSVSFSIDRFIQNNTVRSYIVTVSPAWYDCLKYRWEVISGYDDERGNRKSVAAQIPFFTRGQNIGSYTGGTRRRREKCLCQ